MYLIARANAIAAQPVPMDALSGPARSSALL